MQLCQRHKAHEEKVLTTETGSLRPTHAAIDTTFQTDVNIQQPLLTAQAASNSHMGPTHVAIKGLSFGSRGHNAPAKHQIMYHMPRTMHKPSVMRSPQQDTQDGTTGRTVITTAAPTNAIQPITTDTRSEVCCCSGLKCCCLGIACNATVQWQQWCRYAVALPMQPDPSSVGCTRRNAAHKHAVPSQQQHSQQVVKTPSSHSTTG